MQVPYNKDTNIVELIKDRSIHASIDENTAILSFSIKPREPLCILADYIKRLSK